MKKKIANRKATKTKLLPKGGYRQEVLSTPKVKTNRWLAVSRPTPHGKMFLVEFHLAPPNEIGALIQTSITYRTRDIRNSELLDAALARIGRERSSMQGYVTLRLARIVAKALNDNMALSLKMEKKRK